MNTKHYADNASVVHSITMKTMRVAALGCVLLVAVPLANTTLAEGATTRGGCTVSPLRPFATGKVSKNNLPYIQSRIQIDCTRDRIVKVEHQLWEDNGETGDVPVPAGPTEASKHQYKAGAHAIWFERAVGQLDADHTNEMYQRVRFYTCSIETEPVCTAKTEWEASYPPREIHIP
jgi:hypothetical protein